MEPCGPASPSRCPIFCKVAVRPLILSAAFAASIGILLPNAWATPAATTTTLSVTSSGSGVTSVPSGTVVTLTATVVAGSTRVNPGQVKFCDATAAHCEDSALLATTQLTSAGKAIYKFRPGIGRHSYQAVFVGTSSYEKSTSTSADLSVTPTEVYSTTTAIASSGSPGDYTLTATVAARGSSAFSPAGDVTFLDTTNGNVLLGTATLGTATPQENLTTGFTTNVGSYAPAMAAGDFNGDGILDLATAIYGNGSAGTTTVQLGNGDGTFTEMSGTSFTDSPWGIAVGDFNGDGIPDLAETVNGRLGTLLLLLGKGDGTFTLKTYLHVGNNPLSLAVGDFNGDGNLDIATANTTDNTVTVLLGNGDGTFTTKSTPTVGNAPGSVAAGDFNGDGIPDLVVANGGDNTVSVLLGNGDGTFTTKATLTVSDGAGEVAVGDFNGDGIPDLAVPGNDSVAVLLGNGDGTFTFKSLLSAVTGSVAVDDFNQDGIPDLVIVANSTVTVLLGNGDGTFTTNTSINVGGFNSVGAVGDFNGDGAPDLATLDGGDGTMTALLNQLMGTATATLSHVTVSGAETHQVLASYPGDANHGSSISSTVPLLTTPVVTALQLSSSSNPSVDGNAITLSASLSPYSYGSLTTNGETLTFYNGGTSIGTGTLTSGVATLNIASLPAGTDTLTARYPGDGDFTPAISNSLAHMVLPTPVVTALQLSSSSNPSLPGDAITLTATLNPYSQGSLTTNGETVTFYNGGTSIGTASLSSGVATINLNPIPVGTDTLTATYSGDGNFTSASSNSVTFTIAATALTLSSTANTSTYGSPITLTATLNPYSSGSFTTDGEMVTFFSNGASLGSGTLSSGVATLAIAYLPVGTDTVTAAYGGDHNFAASTSKPLTQTVNAGSGPIPGFLVTTSTDDATEVAFNCTGAGSSDCSLRDALSAAAGAGGGNITFVPAVTGISLNVNAGGLYIPSNTTITGPAIGGGVGALIGYSAIFNVNGGVVNAAISNLTIAGNDALANGGGIYNNGQLTVTNCLITGNNGDPLYGGAGSGIFNDSSGNMKLINSTVSENRLSGPGTSYGGGIYNGGTLTVINSSIFNNDVSCGGTFGGGCLNYGAGIANGGTLILTGSSVQGNTALNPGDGGGILNGGILVVTNSIVENNLADGLAWPDTTAEDDCDGSGCPVNGVNGNAVGAPQPTQPAAATPQFSPLPGTYYISQQPITITDITPGAVIFYSTDAAVTWTKYTGPVTVSSRETLQAIAAAPNYTESLIATAIYDNAPPAGVPLITPPGGTYTGAQSVTITDTTLGAVIHYTTDGTTPSLSSPIFNPESPISVTSTQTIKALAIVPGYATSPEGVAAYTIAALAPVISPPTSFYFPPISVTITDGTPNAVIHYTTDGTTPTLTSPVYGGAFTVTSPERVRAIATAPNLAPSGVTNANFDVMSAAAEPIISLPSGTYTGAQMVMITDATPGAVIYYTTNGTTPSRSSAVYSSASPIMVTSSQTIKALAVAPAYATSPEAVARYTIGP
jgi:hypothetical protein